MYTIVIPARLGSTRLPKKMLLDTTGKPLICHTVESALTSRASQIIVATDSQEIVDAVGDRCQCLMTPYCQNGTERIQYTVTALGLEGVIINLQGDEPMMPGKILDDLADSRERVATLATFCEPSEYHDENTVKVVVNNNGNAMYFSRSSIPHGGKGGLKHIGVYKYDVGFLKSIRAMPRTCYESERLEQLQWLEAGTTIEVLLHNIITYGIDTIDDYLKFAHEYKVDSNT